MEGLAKIGTKSVPHGTLNFWVDAQKRTFISAGVHLGEDDVYTELPPFPLDGELEATENGLVLKGVVRHPLENIEAHRRVEAWRKGKPRLPGLMGETKRVPALSFVWQSPDGKYRADLEVSAYIPEEKWDVWTFSMFFQGADEIPLEDIQGWRAKFGPIEHVFSADAEIYTSAAKFWSNPDGRLFVNGVEWVLIQAPGL